MANKNPITNWLLRNRHTFKLSFTQYDWTQRFCPTLFDFTTQIEFDTIKSQGRGTSVNQELAIEKSCAETIERYICKKLKISSVGFSVSGANSALEHAKFEALERYFLDEHIRHQIPFHKIEITECNKEINRSLINLFIDLNKNTSVTFYQMHSLENDYAIVCLIEENYSHLFSFGFSYSKNLEFSIEKSFIEALPNFAALKESILDSDVINSNINNSGSDDLWHLKTDFIKKMKPLLMESSLIHEISSKIKDPELKVEEINISDIPEFNNCPINPVKVSIQQHTVDL